MTMTQREIYDLSKKIAEKKENGSLETYGDVVSRLDKIIQLSDRGVFSLDNKDEITFMREQKKRENQHSLSESKVPESGVTYTIKTKNNYSVKVFIPDADHIDATATVTLGNEKPIDIKEFYDNYISSGYKNIEDNILIKIKRKHYGETFDTSSDESDLKVKRLEILESNEEIVVTDFLSMSRTIDTRKV